MAQDSTNNPWLFDAATQGEGFGPSLDSVSVVFTVRPYINQLKIGTGAGGDVLIYSRKNAGTGNHARVNIVDFSSTPANDTLWVPIDARVDGLYIQTLPTGGRVYAFHGEK